MAINQDTILRVANLAQLQVNEQDCAEMSSRLNDILNMVDELQQVDVGDIAPMAHPLNVNQPLREDRVTEKDIREDVMALAPAQEDGCYLVPRVIE